MKINANKNALEERTKHFNDASAENKKIEFSNTFLERKIIERRGENKKIEE